MRQRLSLSNARVIILGLGLMGGSLALALRGKCAAVYGYDPDTRVLAAADQIQLVDGLTGELGKYLPQSEVIILAAPVKSILLLIDQLPEYHPGCPIVMDIGSTKGEVLQSLEKLPERFDFIGGHPICGKEKQSLDHAEANLFKGSSFVLCASKRTNQETRLFAEEMVHAIEAHPLWMDAEEHDIVTAATSHFPYLLSNAMVAVTPDDARVLIGPGFRSTARISSTSPEMMTDVIMTNRQNLLIQIKRFQDHLELMRTLIESQDDVQMKNLLEEGAQVYHRLIS